MDVHEREHDEAERIQRIIATFNTPKKGDFLNGNRSKYQDDGGQSISGKVRNADTSTGTTDSAARGKHDGPDEAYDGTVHAEHGKDDGNDKLYER